ncbi:MAG TPA: STAS domain-containing protein [Acidimicrobiales bacterium]|nr:STAS domain-containing protein [Acidimicrobiales bacterium]
MAVSESAGHSIVAVAGELDVATSPRLQDAMTRLIEEGQLRLVVDLREVTFLDSSALGVLVGARRRLLPEHGEVSVVCTDPRLLHLLRLTKLDEVFPIYDSVPAAVGATEP